MHMETELERPEEEATEWVRTWIYVILTRNGVFFYIRFYLNLLYNSILFQMRCAEKVISACSLVSLFQESDWWIYIIFKGANNHASGK